ncbi:MAG: tRNA epoxyqueuosine(34) reductase QueG [Phycisphaerales bacterium]
MHADPVNAGRDIVRACLARGFALASVCPALPSARQPEFRAWLAAGKHGDMAFLEEFLDARLDPARLLPGARSFIIVADRYAQRPEAGEPPPAAPDGTVPGRIAKYARGRDYHGVIKQRLHALADSLRPLHPGALFRSFADTAPVLEREHAARAGLGWIGKHTLMIHPTEGSYFVLGGILTTLDLQPDPHAPPQTDRCGTCTRCIDACPTQAITPYSVNASRCISYLTIEHKGEIVPALADQMGEWLFGCDICQDVCPYNQARPATEPTPPSPHPPHPLHPAYTPRHHALDVLHVLKWSAAERTARLTGSAMKRATLDMLKRNALIVLRNAARRTGDPRLLAALERIVAQATKKPPAM